MLRCSVPSKVSSWFVAAPGGIISICMGMYDRPDVSIVVNCAASP